MNETTQEFRNKLFALLREYNVEMQVEEDMVGYGNMATGVNFFSYDEWDDAGNVVRPGVNLTIGTYEDGKE